MADLDDVRRLAPGCPACRSAAPTATPCPGRCGAPASCGSGRCGAGELEALGAAAPTGTVLGVRVADLGVKQALLTADPDVVFTTPHFDGYPAVLVRLDAISPVDLEELVVDAWRTRASQRQRDQLDG